MHASRIVFPATLIGVMFGGCVCDEYITPISPKIEIGDPYDPQFSVCETDYIRDCAYSFGEVPIGAPKHFAFVIHNPSQSALTIKSITFAEGGSPRFTFEGELPTVVEKGAGEIVTVKFDPDVEGSQTATIIIDSDAQNLAPDENVEIVLTADGVDRGQPDIVITPPQCDFGAVGVGQTAFCDLTIENAGVRELQITQSGFSDTTPTPDVFGAESPLIAPTFIQPGTGISVRLYARPNSLDLITGELLLESNDRDTPTASVPLSVQGANTPTAVARVKTINGVANNAPSPSVEPLDNVVLSGDQSIPGTNGATITNYSWSIIDKPVESSVTLTSASQMDTGFVFSSASGNVNGLDVAGTFTVALTVTDSTGAVSTNNATVTLNAVPTEGLHVQLTWTASVDDIDLHLGRSAAPDWCSLDDCYYGNCTYSPPDWDNSGSTAGDPQLDIDDLSGFGPENINIDSPGDGVYVIGVHAFSGNGTSSGGFTATDLTIKVFLGGALAGEYFGHFDNDDDFWTAARIDIVGGVGSVTEIGSFSTDWSCW